MLLHHHFKPRFPAVVSGTLPPVRGYDIFRLLKVYREELVPVNSRGISSREVRNG
jgi:hypothetical protein